jgi:transcription termination factor Rho
VSEDKTTETTAPVSAPTTPEPTPIEQATPPAATPAAAPPDDGETATPEERPAGRTLSLNSGNSSSESDNSGEDSDEDGGKTNNGRQRNSDAEGNDQNNNGGGNGRGRRNKQRRPKRDPNTPSANPMSLTDLKTKSTQELIDMAREMGLENMARSRKQDIIFALLKRHAKSGEDIWGDGVLEILQDGFGFLRSADSSYLAGPDDIYVSPRAKSAALTCAPVTPSPA